MNSRAIRAGRRALLMRCVLLPVLGFIVYLFLVVFRLGPALAAARVPEAVANALHFEAIVWGALGFLVAGPLIGYRRTRRDDQRARWHDAWSHRLADWRPGEPVIEPPDLPETEEPIDEELDRLLETLLKRADRVAEKKDRRIQGMRAMLNKVEEGIVIMGPDGDLEFINETIQRLYDLQDLPSKRKKRRRLNRRLYNEIRDQAVVDLVDRVRSGEEFAEVSFRQASDLGRMLHVRCYRLPEPSFDLLLIFRDVTKQHQLENLRREFVANVGHELRTPLAAIKGYLETLQEPETLSDAKTAQHFLGIIQRNTTRLEALIADLLELSRLDGQDGRPQELERVKLADLMQRPLEVVGPKARERGIELRVDVPETLPFIMGRRGQLEQVVINLLTNAIQYSDPGTAVEVAAAQEKDEVVLRVADQGIGIDPEHHERIFERFYRVDRDRSRAAGGTGLGLSIVKHIVQQCGGTIALQSARGKGSIFAVRLRRAELLT